MLHHRLKSCSIVMYPFAWLLSNEEEQSPVVGPKPQELLEMTTVVSTVYLDERLRLLPKKHSHERILEDSVHTDTFLSHHYQSNTPCMEYR